LRVYVRPNGKDWAGSEYRLLLNRHLFGSIKKRMKQYSTQKTGASAEVPIRYIRNTSHKLYH
jgi:hypothetical protein